MGSGYIPRLDREAWLTGQGLSVQPHPLSIPGGYPVVRGEARRNEGIGGWGLRPPATAVEPADTGPVLVAAAVGPPMVA